LGVGLFVDYLMHIHFRYYESPRHRHEKIVELLNTMGTSILLGGPWTLIGLMPLLFQYYFSLSSYLYSYAWYRGTRIKARLDFLPVLLPMFGPEVQIKHTR
jgi:Patched family